jgi:hypothetical protein
MVLVGAAAVAQRRPPSTEGATVRREPGQPQPQVVLMRRADPRRQVRVRYLREVRLKYR